MTAKDDLFEAFRALNVARKHLEEAAAKLDDREQDQAEVERLRAALLQAGHDLLALKSTVETRKAPPAR